MADITQSANAPSQGSSDQNGNNMDKHRELVAKVAKRVYELMLEDMRRDQERRAKA
jgi:hypothetical protein